MSVAVRATHKGPDPGGQSGNLRSERVFTKWDYLLFIPLTLLGLGAITNFLGYIRVSQMV